MGGLPLASTVLLDQIAGIDATRVIRKLGRLTIKEFESIRKGLKTTMKL
jgi:mRNA-degrading endonuclease toxin of MazEF toxin-antitoxin module